MTTAISGLAVILCFPIVVGDAPLDFNEAYAFDAPQRGVESALFHQEGVVALMTDEAGDVIAIKRVPDKGLEDENIEGTAKNSRRVCSMPNHSPWNSWEERHVSPC